MKIIYFGAFIRILFSIVFEKYEFLFILETSDYLIKLGGQGYDDKRFYLEAVQIARGYKELNFQIGIIFTSFIGLIFRYTAESYFLGSILSILAWFFSAIIFKKNLEFFNINLPAINYALFFYILLPSSIIYSSLILRESYQLLLINLFCFCFFKITMKNNFKYSLLLIISLLALSYLHKVFIIFSFIIIIIFLIILTKKMMKYLFRFRYFNILFLFSIFSLILISENYLRISDLIFKNISEHVNNLTLSRSNYQNNNLELLSYFDFFSYLCTSFYNYFFQPTITRVENYFDFLLFFENYLRVIFLFLSLINIIKVKMRNYKYLLIIFFFYILIETLWALGTNNYGTAVRHHMPQIGLLLLLTYFSNLNIKKP